jgi:hypothetical protein
MSDESALDAINRLAAEEHELRAKESAGDVSDENRARLAQLDIELDRCWDLLRQRRARREAGLNPDDAHVRDANTVEGYQQ